MEDRRALEGARLAQDVKRRLSETAQPGTKALFEERWVLGTWRGNLSHTCRSVVRERHARWRAGLEATTYRGDDGKEVAAETVEDDGPGVASYHAAMDLMRSPFSDDKLAGMMLFRVRDSRPIRRNNWLLWPQKDRETSVRSPVRFVARASRGDAGVSMMLALATDADD